MSKAKLFLLEDDATLNETLVEFLEEEGYGVSWAYNGLEAEDMLYESRYDLLLLDVNTPGINGFELLSNIRKRGQYSPAIFISSLNSVDDLEKGFASGCDDYIRKPFELKELLIRVETLLKRGFYHQDKAYITLDKNIKYDIDTHTLIINDTPVYLGNKEAILIKLFVKSPNEIISHERIYSYLWDFNDEPSDTALRTYIKNLRKIIGKEKIVSIKKQGYKFIINQ